jgi:hypothetical protein
MLAFAGFAAIAVEIRIEGMGERLRHEELAFVKRSEGNRAGRVRAFLKHCQCPVFSLITPAGERP